MPATDKPRSLLRRRVTPLTGVLLLCLMLVFIAILLNQDTLTERLIGRTGAAAIVGVYELGDPAAGGPLCITAHFKRDGSVWVKPRPRGVWVVGRWTCVDKGVYHVTTPDSQYHSLLFTLKDGRLSVRAGRPEE